MTAGRKSPPLRSTGLVSALFFLGSPIVRAQSPGTFTPTGSMMTPRFSHTATLLPDGRVLIAGGDISCSLGAPCTLATTGELYDPASGTFSAAGAMNTIQPVGGILLPNGTVFFVDGYPPGGGYPAAERARIELYDPSSGKFEIAGVSASLTTVGSAALLNNGSVLMIGLATGAEIYDPVAGTFTPTATSPGAEFGAVIAVLPDNRILLGSPALFDPATGTVTNLARSSTAR
jgi:hypothetical protein